MGIHMDLDFKLLETGSLFISVLVTAFTLQVMKILLGAVNFRFGQHEFISTYWHSNVINQEPNKNLILIR
jgi:hypothetical protein